MLGQRAGALHDVKGQRGQQVGQWDARFAPAAARQRRHAARPDQALPRAEKPRPRLRARSVDVWECVAIPSVSTDFSRKYKRILTSANFRKALGLSRTFVSTGGHSGQTKRRSSSVDTMNQDRWRAPRGSCRGTAHGCSRAAMGLNGSARCAPAGARPAPPASPRRKPEFHRVDATRIVTPSEAGEGVCARLRV